MPKSNIKIKIDNNALHKVIKDAISKSNFEISCPNCKTKISVNGSKFGTNINCPNCNVSINLNDDKMKKDINKIKF